MSLRFGPSFKEQFLSMVSSVALFYSYSNISQTFSFLLSMRQILAAQISLLQLSLLTALPLFSASDPAFLFSALFLSFFFYLSQCLWIPHYHSSRLCASAYADSTSGGSQSTRTVASSLCV